MIKYENALSKKEIAKELNLALDEIGPITPWFDKDVNAWVFEHWLYPVGCSGDSAKEVIENFPKYLEIFIEHRMRGKIDEVNERKTHGKGGSRPGAGRPKGTAKGATKQIRVPTDIADGLKTPGVIPLIRTYIQVYKQI